MQLFSLNVCVSTVGVHGCMSEVVSCFLFLSFLSSCVVVCVFAVKQLPSSCLVVIPLKVTSCRSKRSDDKTIRN